MNFDRLSAGIEIRHGLTDERQPIMMLVLMGPARHRQPVVLVLDEAPDQIVQRPQGIEFEFPQWIVRRTTPILETRAIAFIV